MTNLSSQLGPLIVTIVILAFVALGLLPLKNLVTSVCKTVSAKSWPTAYAEIKEVGIKEDDDSECPPYSVEVLYSFSVENRDYSGDTIAFGYRSDSIKYEVHAELFSKLRPAKVVVVRYNPKNPRESCIAAVLHGSQFCDALVYFTFILALNGIVTGTLFPSLGLGSALFVT